MAEGEAARPCTGAEELAPEQASNELARKTRQAIFVRMLAMRLGTILLRDAVITLTQLEQSLRAQVLGGGLLGTNLVELGFLEINTLGRYLARVLDTPLAIADHFEKADPKLIATFGAEMAGQCAAMPLHMAEDEPHTIVVAMRNPGDKSAIAAMERQLGLQVRPYVAPELRLFYYLEHYYGIQRRTRYTRPPEENAAAPNSRRERRATQPFRGLSAEPISILPSKDRDTPLPPPPARATTCSFEEACEEIAAAKVRQDIADAILHYTVGRFECAAVFMVRSGCAIGWRAQAKGLGADALERLNLSLSASSVFQSAYDASKPYRGPALTPGHPLEKQLWDGFALEYQPTDLHVVPVSTAQRIVNLIYAHAAPADEISEQEASELVQLGAAAEATYQRMLDEITG